MNRFDYLRKKFNISVKRGDTVHIDGRLAWVVGAKNDCLLFRAAGEKAVKQYRHDDPALCWDGEVRPTSWQKEILKGIKDERRCDSK